MRKERRTMTDIPETQYAVQLVGPDELVLNKSKEVYAPEPHQILCRVEAVGLCFSDLKLLKQFSSHVRKGRVVYGGDHDIQIKITSAFTLSLAPPAQSDAKRWMQEIKYEMSILQR